MSDVVYIILRRLRVPIVILIVVYAISVGGLALMPGTDPQGNPWRLGFFHAFYVMSYTATTIGFGEVPYPFSDAQRAWLILSIYLSVIGWAYALGTIFSLTGDVTFQKTVARAVLRWRTSTLGEPFYIICGCGQSGIALAHALDRMGFRLVLIESRAERAAQVQIRDFGTPALVLEADARLPDVLEDAGVRSPECRGLIALTSACATNQSIAIGAKVLHKDLQVIARVKDSVAQNNLLAFGDVTIINPFQTFATNAALDVTAPEVLRLEDWLTDPPGSPIPVRVNIPKGPWVILGFGRFGQALSQQLDDLGIEWRAIDPNPHLTREARVLPGDNTESALRAARLARAAVFVAGTDDDSVNLGMVTLARRLNPSLFIVIRQNQAADRVLIDSARANLRFVQSELLVRECLQVLKDPLLGRFIMLIRSGSGAQASRVIEAIMRCVGNRAPTTWTFHCNVMAPGLFGTFLRHPDQLPRIGSLLRDPADPQRRMQAVPLLLVHRDSTIVLPDERTILRAGDRVLFAGRRRERAAQARYLNEPDLLETIRTGRFTHRSAVFRWWHRRRAQRAGRASGGAPDAAAPAAAPRAPGTAAGGQSPGPRA
ncbi:MAG: NAD-binding protein [Lautropia sp.]